MRRTGGRRSHTSVKDSRPPPALIVDTGDDSCSSSSYYDSSLSSCEDNSAPSSPPRSPRKLTALAKEARDVMDVHSFGGTISPRKPTALAKEASGRMNVSSFGGTISLRDMAPGRLLQRTMLSGKQPVRTLAAAGAAASSDAMRGAAAKSGLKTCLDTSPQNLNDQPSGSAVKLINGSPPLLESCYITHRRSLITSTIPSSRSCVFFKPARSFTSSFPHSKTFLNFDPDSKHSAESDSDSDGIPQLIRGSSSRAKYDSDSDSYCDDYSSSMSEGEGEGDGGCQDDEQELTVSLPRKCIDLCPTRRNFRHELIDVIDHDAPFTSIGLCRIEMKTEQDSDDSDGPPNLICGSGLPKLIAVGSDSEDDDSDGPPNLICGSGLPKLIAVGSDSEDEMEIGDRRVRRAEKRPTVFDTDSDNDTDVYVHRTGTDVHVHRTSLWPEWAMLAASGSNINISRTNRGCRRVSSAAEESSTTSDNGIGSSKRGCRRVVDTPMMPTATTTSINSSTRGCRRVVDTPMMPTTTTTSINSISTRDYYEGFGLADTCDTYQGVEPVVDALAEFPKGRVEAVSGSIEGRIEALAGYSEAWNAVCQDVSSTLPPGYVSSTLPPFRRGKVDEDERSEDGDCGFEMVSPLEDEYEIVDGDFGCMVVDTDSDNDE